MPHPKQKMVLTSLSTYTCAANTMVKVILLPCMPRTPKGSDAPDKDLAQL
jgi:hypothetical protein